MSKVITFSRRFPSGHPRRGEETFFAEKVIKSFEALHHPIEDVDHLFLDEIVYEDCTPKFHTIRAGNRWKVGDLFSPRVWSGKPYYSQQVNLAPDVKIVKIWQFEMRIEDGKQCFLMPTANTQTIIHDIATNDGLLVEDFKAWFNEPFTGQIICWNPLIEY